MRFKDPSMVGQQSFEGVSQQVDEEKPQSRGKQDGAQHSSGLHWHTVSAQKGYNNVFINDRTEAEIMWFCLKQESESEPQREVGGLLTCMAGSPLLLQSCPERDPPGCTRSSSWRWQQWASWMDWRDRHPLTRRSENSTQPNDYHYVTRDSLCSYQ